jgi:putative tricarboxylic transport membrane protein
MRDESRGRTRRETVSTSAKAERSTLHAILRPCAFVLLCAFAALANAQEWKPSKNVEIIVSTGAGGASDRQARTVQRLVEKVPGIPSITVANRPGGGGTVALAALSQHSGDAHHLYVMQSGLLVNRIVGRSKFGYQDFSPLSMLMREHIIAWVKSDSPLQSGKDLIASLRKDPRGLTFGLSNALGNQNHILIGMLARAAGVDPKAVKVVVYSSGGQGVTAALGGHVDVWVGSAASAVPHAKSGAARTLGIGAAERQPGPLAEVPTFREQGIEAVFADARGFLGPRDLTLAQVKYWSDAFGRMVREEAWKEELARFGWEHDYRNAAETVRFLEERTQLLTGVLDELGLIRR